MPLRLPDLDDRRFDDLVEEARGLIPAYAPEWTNHNESDPGITLIELFAWLTETLLYRANQVPARHVATFLRVLNGPDWNPSGDQDEDVAATLRALRARYQAVTCEDYEALAAAVSPLVARTHCVPRRYVGAGTEAARLEDRPGHVSVVIVPAVELDAARFEALRQSVWAELDERRVVTTRHHVVGPLAAPVQAEVLVARRPDVPEGVVQANVVEALERFLDPLRGGRDGTGWPFGRSVYVSELYELLERVPGVDFVPDLEIRSECGTNETGCIRAKPVWHETGELVELAVEPHHLPDARIADRDVVTSTRFVRVAVRVRATRAALADSTTVKRAIRGSLRRLFHPLHDWSADEAGRDVTVTRLKLRIGQLAAVVSPAEVELASDPRHEIRNDAGDVVAVRLTADELADLLVTIEVQELQ